MEAGGGSHGEGDLACETIADRNKRMFAARSDHVLFFDATDDVEYGFAVEMLDKARESHAVTIAPLGTPPPGPDAP